MNLKETFEEYKDVLPYLFFGVCTTLVNVIGYWICAYLFKFGVMPSTIIAWILAVLFAYVTNRKWVFKSKAQNRREIIREACYFFYMSAGYWNCRLGKYVFVCYDFTA